MTKFTAKLRDEGGSIVEVIMILLLFIMGVTASAATDVMQKPFVYRNETENASMLIVVAIAMNVGKYIYVILLRLLHFESSANFKLDLIHHIVTLVCYTVILMFEENLLLAVMGLLMEMSTVSSNTLFLCKKLKVDKNRSTYKKISLLNCVFTITFRDVIPVIFLIIGLMQGSPFQMGYASLIFFFLSIIFYSVISVYLSINSVLKLKSLYSKQTMNENTSDECPRTRFSTGSSRLSRMIKNDIPHVRSYENKNVYNNENSKLNIINKKAVTKDDINLVISGLKDGGSLDLRSSDSETCSVESNQDSTSSSNDPTNSLRTVIVNHLPGGAFSNSVDSVAEPVSFQHRRLSASVSMQNVSNVNFSPDRRRSRSDNVNISRV